MALSLKLAKEIRRESANDIGARSCQAAIKPDIKLQPTSQCQNNGSLANGMRSY
ncbi:oxidoreductase, partial [Photorhabdus cinerea]|nr:oxidoreductase [Photorhabdus cinerea]